MNMFKLSFTMLALLCRSWFQVMTSPPVVVEQTGKEVGGGSSGRGEQGEVFTAREEEAEEGNHPPKHSPSHPFDERRGCRLI